MSRKNTNVRLHEINKNRLNICHAVIISHGSGRLAAQSARLGQLFGRQQRVHGARAKAFQVEGYELEPQRLESTSECRRHFWSHGARQFLAGDLDAHDVTMMADPELPEAKL